MVARNFVDIIQHIKDGTYIPETLINDIVHIGSDFGKDAQISNVTFNKSVVVSIPSADNNINFINCVFNAPFSFGGRNNLKNLGFFDCQFNSSFSINNVSATKFEIAGCFLKRGISSHNLIAETLRLELLKSESAKFNFLKPHLSNCFISKIKDGTQLMFSSFDEKVSQDNTSYISNLSIRCEFDFTGELLFHVLKIDTISLSGYNKGRINFQTVSTGNINCQHFVNLGFMNVSSLKTELPGRLYLYNSNLGKCEIFNVDFSFFDSPIIIDSSIQDIVPTNVTWCNEIQANIIKDNSSPLHLRESYRQLKNIMIKNNDKIEELKYYNLEMEAYHSHLKKAKGNFGEKFIIRTNKISNNHGLSWLTAFYWIIGLSLFFFNLNKFLLGYNSFNINLFWKDAANWLQSINPVRKFADVYTDNSIGWKSNLALFLDVFSRIVYSYLLFQFISAFRKYVKK